MKRLTGCCQTRTRLRPLGGGAGAPDSDFFNQIGRRIGA